MHSVRKNQPVSVNELYPSEDREIISLSGLWEFSLDPEGKGLAEQWQAPGRKLGDTIQVPGCLEGQGKGITYAEPEPPDWWGTSDKPYLGVSWNKKTFLAPPVLAGQRAMLNFGGVATDCDVYLNGALLGRHEYAIIPFGFDVTELLKEGDNEVCVRVENNHEYVRAPLNHHGLGSTTIEMMWSGIFRDVELSIQNEVSIDNLYLRYKDGTLLARYALSCPPQGYTVRLNAHEAQSGAPAGHACALAGESVSLPMPDAHLWSDRDPFLYKITLELFNEKGERVDSLSRRFGLREITFEDGKICINHTPVYLRGDMTHFHWPVTVSQPVDRDDIKKKLSVYKDFGMNLLRHHSHFPSPEYLDVCDEIGLLCHNELGICGGLWGIEEEHRAPLWSLALTRDRNHASILLWCLGNEKLLEEEVIREYKNITFAIDDTRLLLTDSPGWFVFPDGSREREPVMHEFRMSGASYIDLKLMDKYKEEGCLRPWRMEFTQKQLERSGMLGYAERFTYSTQRLQERCRKILLENIRENNVDVEELFNLHGMDYSGFVLSTFRDSGSFLWGTVDDFFGAKATPPQVFRNYCGDTVLLLGVKWTHRIFKSNEGRPWMPLAISCSHYGKQPVRSGLLNYHVEDEDGNVVYRGHKSGVNIECGQLKNIDVQVYIYDMPPKNQKLTVHAHLTDGTTDVRNHWDVWMAPPPDMPHDQQRRIAFDVTDPWLVTQLMMVYRQIDGCAPEESDLLITDRITDKVEQQLRRGKRVLLTGQSHFPVRVTEFGSGRSEYARGTVIMDHPVMKNVSHDGWCDLPFAGLISENRVLEGNRDSTGCAYILDERWPKELEPIIMGVPSYKDVGPQRLAHLFEVKCGEGVLMASTLNFGSPFAQSAFDFFFLDEVLKYLMGGECNPKAQVDVDCIMRFKDFKVEPMEFALRDVNVFATRFH